MKHSRLRATMVALSLAPLLTAGLCPSPPRSGTYDIVVTSADPSARGIVVAVASSELKQVLATGPQLTDLDTTSIVQKWMVSGPLTVGETAFMVKVSDQESIPTILVLQAAKGASGGFATLNPASFTFRPILQSR